MGLRRFPAVDHIGEGDERVGAVGEQPEAGTTVA
jgi:hypothetical protein